MPSVTKFPQRILQRGGNEFAEFNKNLLYRVKVDDESKIKSSVITGKSGPSPQLNSLECDYFNFDLPVGAEITGIAVAIGHYKEDKVQGQPMSIGRPVVQLMNAGLPNFPDGVICDETYVDSPTYELAETRAHFDGEYILYYSLDYINSHPSTVVDGWNSTRTARTYHGSYDLPSREQVNNKYFGVKITYPKNTSNNAGYIWLRHIYVRIWYNEPNYGLKVEKLSSDAVYVGFPADYKISLTNINLVNYVTSVVITLPEGATVDRYQGIGDSGGTVRINGTQVTWIPPQSNKRANYGLLLSIKFAVDADVTITAVEQLLHVSSSISSVVYPTPTGIISEDIDSENIIYAKTGINFVLPIRIPVSMLEMYPQIYLIPDNSLDVKPNNSWSSLAANEAYSIPISAFDENGCYNLTCRSDNLGITNIGISTSTTSESNTFIVKVIDSNLTTPRISVIKLKEEELDRLGDGFIYMVNSQLNISGSVEDISNFHDYYRNFRMGVVNNIPETVDATAVFEACKNWSEGLESFNNYIDRTVEFAYDENYPVYIVFTGDYVDENDYFSLKFTLPILLEPETYNGYDTLTLLPEPILNVINTQENVANLTLEPFSSSNPIRIYDFPFNEGFGTDNSHAIQGIELVCNISCDSQAVLFAKLKSPHGKIGTRSIVLYNGENTFSVGGEFDKWGFNITELTNLKEWEVELELQNLGNESQINATFESISIIAHFIDVKQNLFNVFVDGETMRLHGMFVQSVDINPGVKSKCSYISIEGSDSHDPMTMNIQAKEIEIKFNVRGCTIEETTKLLREIARILANDRDELNRPIPKRIAFSHIPGYHWDYILEGTIDADLKNGGYACKVKLEIYDGTSWADVDTITNVIGVNESITKVSPVIQFVPLSSSVEITEETHNQKFTITNPNFNMSQVVTIDCANQRVYLRENSESDELDITNLTDWDVDWFILYQGEYSFEDHGTCIIQNVVHTQRGA